MKKFCFVILAAALSARGWGQLDTRINAPGPALPSASSDVNAEQVHPLSGIQSMVTAIAPNDLTVSGYAAAVADSGGTNRNAEGWTVAPNTSAGGQMYFRHRWQHSTLVAEYAGGTVAGQQTNQQVYQELSVTDSLALQRWNFVLGSHVSYLPESHYGFNSLHDITGNVNATLDPQVLPSESILTAPTTQWNGVVTGEVDFALTGRTAITSSAAYTISRFGGQSLLDSNALSASVGFNHAMSPLSFYAVSYSYGRSQFSALGTSLVTNGFQLSYGRRLRPRVSVKMGVGPVFRDYVGNLALFNLAPTFTAFAALNYERGRTDFGLGYSRQTSSGSGVLPGSNADLITGSASRKVGRAWNLSGTIGYARNQGLEPVSLAGNQTFNSAYGSVQIGRDIGSMISVFVNYGIQSQQGVPFCTAGTCTPFPARHVIVAGINFHRGLRIHQ